MGTCDSGCLSGSKAQRTTSSKKAEFLLDENHKMMSSYARNKSTFTKTNYDWFSIPIISPIDMNCTTTFSVKNVRIKDNSFLVGIIKARALENSIRMPWKTSDVICFESHKNKGQSGVVYQGFSEKCQSGVQEGETVHVIINSKQIKYQIEGTTLAYSQIPEIFIDDVIYPYVTLFQQGDQIELKA